MVEYRIFVAIEKANLNSQETPMQILDIMFDRKFKILIDSGAIERFISSSLIQDMPKALEFLTEGCLVDYGSRKTSFIN